VLDERPVRAAAADGGRLDRVAARQRRRRRLEQLGHEADVRDGQPERLDPGQALLVRERGHLAPQLVERLVQVVHAPALAYVRRAPLRQRGHAPTDFLRRRRRRRRRRGRRLLRMAAAPGIRATIIFMTFA